MYQTFPNILHAPEQMQQNALKSLTFLSFVENKNVFVTFLGKGNMYKYFDQVTSLGDS